MLANKGPRRPRRGEALPPLTPGLQRVTKAVIVWKTVSRAVVEQLKPEGMPVSARPYADQPKAEAAKGAGQPPVSAQS